MGLNLLQLMSLLKLNCLIFGQWEPLDMSILVPETLCHDARNLGLLSDNTKCPSLISYVSCPRQEGLVSFSEKACFKISVLC